MAELDASSVAGSSGCCTPERQRSRCEPSEKDGCCSADSSLCECADGDRSAALALPMFADCGLDEHAAGEQLGRYLIAGAGATVIERTPRRVVAQIDRRVPDGLIAELVDVERGCCPFFELHWDPKRRRLEISVSSNERERALDAIASALFQR